MTGNGEASDHATRRLLLFLVTEDWYFWSHRLPMARAAQAAGFRVAVATRCTKHADRIRGEGFEVYPLAWKRRSFSPLAMARDTAAIIHLYRRLRPVLVHHVALKPVLLGSVAAVAARTPRVLNALTGLGFSFVAAGRRAALRRAVGGSLRLLLRRAGTMVVVQNTDDMEMLTTAGIVAPDRIRVIRGSGVDLDRFVPLPDADGPFTMCQVSRMLEDKGISVLVEAHRLLSQRGVDVRLLLAGMPDPENPTAVSEERLRAWAQDPKIEWLGHVEDVVEVWRRAHVAVLASRGEGLPLSLMEAAACGRAIVATDVPGCREVAVRGRNALLVPPDDAKALAEAIERLARDPKLRIEMAAESRRVVMDGLSAEQIGRQTVALYRELVGQMGSTGH